MRQRDPYRELDLKLLGEAMISDHGLALLRQLCDTHGSRFAGSADERRAGQFLLSSFRDWGLDKVRAEPFALTAWRRGRKPALKTLAPRPVALDAISLPYCPPTRKGGVDLDVANLGEGMPEDFRRMRRQIRGKAVLVTSESPAYYHRWVHRAEKYALAVACGARAFLFVNHQDGLLAPTGSIRFNRKAEIPGLGLAKETGHRLLRLAAGGPVRIHLETHDATFRARSANIVGELRGTERPDEVVVVGGHYDGHDISQGAADNGSGVATVAEAARLLAPHRSALKGTVRFVCFGAEEVGLIGSHAYVGKHAAELGKTRLMVNVDTIGASRGKGYNFHGWDEAKVPLSTMAADLHDSVPFASRPNAYSDHFPFLVAGVPNCSLGNVTGGPAGRGYGHTAADTFDKVGRADLREAAALLARSLIRFANERAWALRHKSAQQIRALLDRYEIRTALRTEGTLPKELK